MTKNEFIDSIAERFATRKAAVEAVDAVLEGIQAAVAKGEKVALTGFGTFEKTDRAEREGRNPATGATIKIPAKSVPTFKAGADFKKQVADQSKT